MPLLKTFAEWVCQCLKPLQKLQPKCLGLHFSSSGTFYLVFLLSLILIVALSFAIQSIFGKPKAQIAMVNVNAIVNRYIKEKASSNLDNETLKTETNHYMRQIETELELAAKEYQVIILLSEAVLKGAMDLTEVIQKKLDAHFVKPKRRLLESKP